MNIFERLLKLVERWDEETFRRAVDQHHGKLPAKGAPPAEDDLTRSESFKMLIKSYPTLEKQLKLAWNGDVRAKEKSSSGVIEDEYIFPKLLNAVNLKKYASDFVENQPTMRTVKELFDLFCERFKVANPKHNGWFSY